MLIMVKVLIIIITLIFSIVSSLVIIKQTWESEPRYTPHQTGNNATFFMSLWPFILLQFRICRFKVGVPKKWWCYRRFLHFNIKKYEKNIPCCLSKCIDLLMYTVKAKTNVKNHEYMEVTFLNVSRWQWRTDCLVTAAPPFPH